MTGDSDESESLRSHGMRSGDADVARAYWHGYWQARRDMADEAEDDAVGECVGRGGIAPAPPPSPPVPRERGALDPDLGGDGEECGECAAFRADVRRVSGELAAWSARLGREG